MRPQPDAAALTPPRWTDNARRLGGYGAAAAMSVYLLVKIAWVAAGLVVWLVEGTRGDGAQQAPAADFLALNAVTVVMAGVGVALGLGLAQPWGLRVPGPVVIICSWVGAGFLVPLLPYLLAVGLLTASGVIGDRGSEETTDLPAWESAFLTIGFAGMALGLTIALPAYVWRRWPTALGVDARSGRPTLGIRPAFSPVTAAALVAATANATAQILWAVGANAGLHPDRQHDVDLAARLLYACWGLWALIAAWSLWRSVRPRDHTGGRRWLPVVLAFTASGCAFAWGAWGLFAVTLRPAGYLPVQYVGVAVALHAISIGYGLVLLAAVLRPPGRRARRSQSNVRPRLRRLIRRWPTWTTSAALVLMAGYAVALAVDLLGGPRVLGPSGNPDNLFADHWVARHPPDLVARTGWALAGSAVVVLAAQQRRVRRGRSTRGQQAKDRTPPGEASSPARIGRASDRQTFYRARRR